VTTRMKRAVAAILAATLPLTSASADVGSSMDSFLNDVGGAANINGPTAFEGQSAGYYSLGNVWTRFPQKTTNIANLQLPRARAGCGGIDLFAGSFSFINAGEIVAMLKAVANNAVGFAFSLAIDTVCPECSKIMQEFAQKAQLMNNLNINSCELAQGLVGGIWPKGDLADKAICEAIGNSEGIFTDYAAAKHGCGTRGQRSSTTAAGAGKYDDVNPGVPRNYTWTILKKSAFFSPGGRFDEELAEYAMTLLGTIIYVPPKDDEPGKFVPIFGEASSTLVTSLLDGTSGGGAGGNVLIFHCDEPDKCLDPGFRSLNLPVSKSLRRRVSVLIDGMVQAIPRCRSTRSSPSRPPSGAAWRPMIARHSPRSPASTCSMPFSSGSSPKRAVRWPASSLPTKPSSRSGARRSPTCAGNWRSGRPRARRGSPRSSRSSRKPR